ncbi:MAG: organomercurial lyase [Candidatus Neomarinimicrobiota bacterium]
MKSGKEISKEKLNGFLQAFPNEFLNLSDFERKVSIQIYRELAKGKPVSITNIAESLGYPFEKVNTVISNWPGVYYDETKNIIGYWGLTIGKMAHSLKVDDVTLTTWCAWDALFIPQILGKTAEITSEDLNTKEKIRIAIAPDGIEKIDPPKAVVSFMVPDTDKIRADVVSSFCHYVHFFSSIESADHWIANSNKKDELIVLSLSEAFEIGSQKNHQQYKELINGKL